MIFSNESRRQQLFSDVSDADWNDWRWQVANRAETLEDLKKYITLTAEEEGVMACLGTLRMAITPYYLSLIDPNDPHDPIRRQAIPTAKELCRCSADLLDPLHEDADAPVPGLTHRYPDRVLMLTTDQCSMYCRHCTRRRFAGQHDTSVPVEQIDQCIAYIRETPAVRDVLLSGGDVLMLSDEMLEYIISRLREIPHVEIVRLGSRTPVVCPQRITPKLCAMLKKYHPVWLNTHFNHPKEITREAAEGDHQGGRRGLRPSGRRRCASGQPVRAARRCERLRPHHEEAGPNAGPDPGTALLRTTPRCRCPLPCR